MADRQGGGGWQRRVRQATAWRPHAHAASAAHGSSIQDDWRSACLSQQTPPRIDIVSVSQAECNQHKSSQFAILERTRALPLVCVYQWQIWICFLQARQMFRQKREDFALNHGPAAGSGAAACSAEGAAGMAHLHSDGTLAHVVWAAGAHALGGGHVVINLIGRLPLHVGATRRAGESAGSKC